MRPLSKAAMVMLWLVAMLAVGQVTPRPTSDLAELRKAFRASANMTIGSIHLTSVQSVNELRISRERTAVIAVGQQSGAVALFRPDGALAAVIETKPVISFQAIQLDEYGPAGIITDEVEAHGTGILIREFKLYSFTTDQQIRLLWHARSFVDEALWSPDRPNLRVSSDNGYVRFDPDGGRYAGRMSYAFRDSSGHWKTKTYRVTPNDVQELK